MAPVAKEKQAIEICAKLRSKGFAAYLAGGCVRDRVLGVPAKDYDIATDARPEVVQSIFEHTVAVGARFGVIMVLIDGNPFEVATFRADAAYVDGRRPSAVSYGTIEEDVRRRDFTIGGMYFDPVDGKVIDLVGGLYDLRAGIIRAIGNPDERFREDHLRLLRAVRFAARLDFTIEPATWNAIQRDAPSISRISAERIGEEIVTIMTEGRAARGLDLLVESGLAEAIMPEVLDLKGCEQPANYHPEGDVYRHTCLMLSMLPSGCTETLAFGTLLHDIAKPRTRAVTPEGKTTYYGHTEQGAAIGADLMRRLRRSRFVQDRVAYLVRYHLRLTMAPRMRPSTLKKMLAEDGFSELLELARFDALGSNSDLSFYHFCRKALASMTVDEIRPPRLIGGDDLISMGFRPGPEFKRILAEVQDLHLDGALASRDDALRYIADHYQTPNVR